MVGKKIIMCVSIGLCAGIVITKSSAGPGMNVMYKLYDYYKAQFNQGKPRPLSPAPDRARFQQVPPAQTSHNITEDQPSVPSWLSFKKWYSGSIDR